MAKSDKRVLGIIFLFFAIAVAATGWRFLVWKDYTLYLEASCDPAKETCFSRDCSNPDECPPNGLSEYKVYQISARDFPKCSDDSCTAECENQTIACTQILCGDSAEDTCAEVADQ